MKDEDFARRFRLAVENAGLPPQQEALGKALGVSGVTAWGYLNGSKKPRVNRATDICGILGVNIQWLMMGQGTMLPDQAYPPEALELLAIYESASPEDRQFLQQTFQLVAAKLSAETKKA